MLIYIILNVIAIFMIPLPFLVLWLCEEKIEPDNTLKMYILIKDDIDLGHAMLAVGHGVLACYREFECDPVMQNWFKNSYRKVVCKVNQKEFDNAKLFPKYVLMTESALDGGETAIVLCPRQEWPKALKWYKLYR